MKSHPLWVILYNPCYRISKMCYVYFVPWKLEMTFRFQFGILLNRSTFLKFLNLQHVRNSHAFKKGIQSRSSLAGYTQHIYIYIYIHMGMFCFIMQNITSVCLFVDLIRTNQPLTYLPQILIRKTTGRYKYLKI